MPKAPKSLSPKATGATRRPRAAAATPPSLPHNLVAQRAYELFVRSGAQHGRDIEHWLTAEQELRSESSARPVLSFKQSA
jgi:DUF2934 family protein